MKIVLSALVAMFLLGCGEDKATQNTQKEENKLTQKEVVAVPAPKKVEKVAVKKVEKAVAKPLPKPEKVVVKKVEKPTSVKVAVKKVEKPAPKKEMKAPVVASVDAKAVFAKCTACHGQHAEKKALNKSQVIRGWSSEKIVNAINGFKDGTYGGSMKGVMKAQVSKLTDAEIKAVAKYISTL